MTTVEGTSSSRTSGIRGPSVIREAIGNSDSAPLHFYESALGEAGVNRVWNKIQEGRLRTPRQGAVRPLVWAACACGLLLMVVTWLHRPQPLAFSTERDVPIGEVVSASPAQRTLRFDDGSQILLHEQGEISVLSNEGASFVTALRAGKAKFSVQPGGTRRWVVDAGEISVEVVGTVFTVERSARGASVAVERGKVLVTDRTTGTKVYLGAGGRHQALAKKRVSEAAPRLEAVSTAASPQQEESPAEVASVSLDQLEREAEPEKLAASVPSAAPKSAIGPRWSTDWLVQADGAKKRGDAATAEALYLRVIRESRSDDPRRGIAAMSYARLAKDPQLIAEVLESTLPSVPIGLREAAWLRLIRAQLGAGDTAGAKRSEEGYLAEFPHGKRRAEIIATVAPE